MNSIIQQTIALHASYTLFTAQEIGGSLHTVYLYRMHNLAAYKVYCVGKFTSHTHMYSMQHVNQQLSKLPTSAVTGSDSTVDSYIDQNQKL